MSLQQGSGPLLTGGSPGGNGAAPTPLMGQTDPAQRRSQISTMEKLFPSLFKVTVKPREVIVFSRQLATLLRSGVTLLSALELLFDQSASSRGMRRVLQGLIEDIGAGGTLSDGMAKQPTVFDNIYHRTVSVGENTGSLETVLLELADYRERQGIFFSKLKSALTYPIIMVVIGVVVVVILVTVVLPPMTKMFATLSADLPAPTRFLLWLNVVVAAYGIYLGGVVVVLVVAGAWYISQPYGRRKLDRLRLFVPVMGPPVMMAEMVRISRTISMLVGAGLPLQEVMHLMPQITSNSVVRDALLQVEEGLILGQGIAAPMATIDIFPPLLVQMVTVGEESNSLDSTLKVVSDFFESSSAERLAVMISLLVPALTISMAVGTGFIALAVIMPMYSIVGNF